MMSSEGRKIAAMLLCTALLGGACLDGATQATAKKTDVKLSDDPRYLQALNALNEGIPQITILKLNECLAGKLSVDDHAMAVLQLARALLAADQPQSTLKALEELPPAPNSDADFLKAQALASLARWEEACPIFHRLSAPANAPLSYKLGEAACLQSLGKTDDAIKVLEATAAAPEAGMTVRLQLADLYISNGRADDCKKVLNTIHTTTASESQWKKYIEGRALFSKRRYEEAFSQFETMLGTPEGLSENLMIGAVLGMTDSRLALSGPEVADNVIEDFIGQHPNIAGLDILFRRLDQIYTGEKDPSETELQNWIEKTPTSRRATLAIYYLARASVRDQKSDKALELVGNFISANPSDPLLPEAWLFQGKILLGQQKTGAAIQSFETAMKLSNNKELRAEAEMACATAYFKQRDYARAQGLYRAAANESDSLWQEAIFNSALSWLYQANYDRFLDDYKALSARYPESELRSELALENGLLQAKSRDPRAVATLQTFIRDFPRHPRVGEARLALAEIMFLSRDPNLGAASRYLKASNESPQSSDAREHSEYLAIFLADAPGSRDEEKAIQLCLAFIKNHPASLQLADVRMKLGEIYFRRGESLNAWAQFEDLANEIPGSHFAETALFLAGQCALKTMDMDKALDLFERVKKINGPLKLHALQQEAILKSRSGAAQDAITLYDNILAANPDPDLKFAALCGKGDNYFLLGVQDPKSYDQAIVAFGEMAAQPDATPYWRSQALYMKGKCYQALADQADAKKDHAAAQTNQGLALEAFYDVMQPQAGGSDGPDYLWFYRAGFAAALVLESQQQWKPAIAIYQKMAAVQGPRSEEAKARLTRLRLEHFIWEE